MTTAAPPWEHGATAARAVALEVLLHGPISRSEIARRLDLSGGSLTRLSTPLIEAGLVVEVEGEPEGRAGRPSRPLDVVASSRHFVGMKLTGTGVEGVLTDLKATVQKVGSRLLPSTEPQEVAGLIAELAAELTAGIDSATAIGIGLGGLIGLKGTVRSAPFLGWTDVPLGPMVEQLSGLPTVIDNDLVALTEAELWFGFGRGLSRFAVVTLGAGVGYGLVGNGGLMVSEDSGIGLVGHWPLDPFGPLCPEGHRGCAKSVLQQDAIARNVSAALQRPVGYEDALELAEGGDPAARRVVDDAGRGLGHLLAAIANLTVPELIILGGEGVRLASVAREAIDAGLAEHRDPRASPLRLEMMEGDNLEWCRGAAVLGIQRYVVGRR